MSQTKPVNIFRQDPSRTRLLRAQFMGEFGRRLKRFSSAVMLLVATQDAFGLDVPKPRPLMFNAGVYSFQTDAQKLKSFNEWLDSQLEAGVLGLEPGENAWSSGYISSAYRQGVVRAFLDTQAKKLKGSGAVNAARSAFLLKAFASPVAQRKVQLLAIRSFEGMKGLTNANKTALNRILADAMANGYGAKKTANLMVAEIETLSRGRAMTIARTEIIHAHSEGQLDGFEALGVGEVGIFAEWLTAGDDRVCARCASQEGKIFTIKEARGLIPLHPNCRCCWLPAEPPEPPKAKK